MRQLKITRDTAVKARTTAMNTLKQIVVHASPVLREALHDLTDHGLLTSCAGFRPGPLDTPTASAKHALRGFCQLDRRKTFFSLIKRPPSLGQQAHVTTSHSTNARVRSTR